MDFSADAIIQNIIDDYIPLFEKAIIEDWHTDKSYINAAEHGNLEYLLTYSKGQNFANALLSAIQFNHLPAVQLLIILDAQDPHITRKQKTGYTLGIALNHAAIHGKINIMKKLIELYDESSGHNRYFDFDDALIYAIKCNQIDTIIFLIKVGAKNVDNALQHAAECNNDNAVAIFIESGAKLNGALICAVRNENINAIKVLAKLGATNFEEAFDESVKYKYSIQDKMIETIREVWEIYDPFVAEVP